MLKFKSLKEIENLIKFYRVSKEYQLDDKDNAVSLKRLACLMDNIKKVKNSKSSTLVFVRKLKMYGILIPIHFDDKSYDNYYVDVQQLFRLFDKNQLLSEFEDIIIEFRSSVHISKKKESKF